MAEDVYDLTPVLDTNAYAANDVLFVATEVKGVFGRTGQARALHSVVVLDGDDQNADFDLVFGNATFTLGTINSAVSISDTDAAKLIGHVSLLAASDATDLVNSRFYSRSAIGLTLRPTYGSGSLWVAGILRSGTPTYSASGMKMKLGFL